MGRVQGNDRSVCGRGGAALRRRPFRAGARHPERCPRGPGRRPGPARTGSCVDAKEIVYDNDSNTVSAVGDVQLNYKGRTLQADRVIYDRNTGRVYAEGNARLTEADGTVITGDRFELTDDFKSGFIDSLRVVQQTTDQRPARSRPASRRRAPSAPRARPPIFERGTYTACEPCKDNPEKPPLWQVKAARIIHNNSERTIYYENATLELAGIPIAYLPYFWSPDPTVQAQDRLPGAALHRLERPRLRASRRPVLLGDRARTTT